MQSNEHTLFGNRDTSTSSDCRACLLCSFDEVYYGQYISFYMKRIFFLDGSGPPFGHMLLALGGRIR